MNVVSMDGNAIVVIQINVRKRCYVLGMSIIFSKHCLTELPKRTN